ncbi:MAG: hypothetical protein R2757_09370 [Draconibacterium sp.]
MSFKIFSLQFRGKIKPVEIIEKKRKSLLDDYNEFLKVEVSEDLKKYIELDSRVTSAEFKKKKAEIEALHFKGSKEYNQLKEFEKLQKNSAIKNYFKIANSADLKRYESLKGSEKLSEYDKLLEYMKEGQFTKDKDEITKQVFKGSVEEKHLKDFKQLEKSAGIKSYNELVSSAQLKKHEEFSESGKLKSFLQLRNNSGIDKEKAKELKKLKNDAEIKSYFKFEKSKKLKLYRETEGSHELKKYNELKTFVESDDFKKREQFLKDKKKFERSEAYKKQESYKRLANDSDVKFLLKFEKSSLYKNYLNVADSFDLKRYHELEKIIGSDEYKKQKAYLEDNKKWEKTEEFALSQEYEQMKKLPHLVKYFKYKNSNSFNFFKEWEITFEDDFTASKPNAEKWAFTSYIANKMLGDNYSLGGDLQVYTSGENIKTNGKLSIEVKKEKKTGKVWQVTSGFLPVELEYTSGIVSTWNSFWQGDGIYEAKIKFNPVKEIVSSFYLSGENNLPRVNLLEMGTKNSVGFSSVNSSGKVETNGLDISNLKPEKWYIFTIEKTSNNYTWKINETEVFAAQNSEPGANLHLNASSMVVYDVPSSKLPASFEIEWVKCYRKK